MGENLRDRPFSGRRGTPGELFFCSVFGSNSRVFWESTAAPATALYCRCGRGCAGCTAVEFLAQRFLLFGLVTGRIESGGQKTGATQIQLSAPGSLSVPL